MHSKRLTILLSAFTLAMLVTAGVVAYLITQHPSAAAKASPPGLVLVGQVSVTKSPNRTAGCGANVSFMATGSLTGSGTLTYQWERSDGVPPVTRQVPVAAEKAFSTDPVYWSFTGTQETNGTMTFHLLSPSDQKVTTPVSDVCR